MSNVAFKRLLENAAPAWSPEDYAARAETRKVLQGFFDFDEFVRRALGGHWEVINPEERTEFAGVFCALFELNFIKEVHGHPNYDLRFTKETISGSEASVEATLETSNQGKKMTASMEYKLLYKGDRWLVYDVIIDEQRMLENYQAEFGKIFTKESFDALLKRLEKRLAKAE